MAARVLIATLLILAVGHATEETKPNDPNPHDLIDCNSKPGDVNLAYAQVVDPGHVLGRVDMDFIYPPEGAVAKNVINCIIIKDLKPELGSSVSITNGTAGDTRVAIQMSSKFTKGVAYSIQIMGQPKKAMDTE